MGPIQGSTIVRPFKRIFDQAQVNELVSTTRFCQREHDVTHFPLILALISALGSGKLSAIVDVMRAFNALCHKRVCYKPFYNQLAKPSFAHTMLERLLNSLANDVRNTSGRGRHCPSVGPAYIRRFHHTAVRTLVTTQTQMKRLAERRFENLVLCLARGGDTVVFKPYGRGALALPGPILMYLGTERR